MAGLNPCLRPLALACAALLAAPADAAPANDETQRLLEKMNARLEQLEQRNAALEQQLKATALPATPALEQRLKTLEETQARVNEGLASDRLSENEAELTSRLKAVEKDALAVQSAARKIDALDGLKAGFSLSTVAQRPRGLPSGTVDGNSQLNYRADVTVELPLSPLGDIEQKIFTHLRIGQGSGLNAPLAGLGGFAAAPNAVAFQASGATPDDSTAILGEAWYQASIPLPVGGFKDHSREKLELSFGKMDLFGFFDQNTTAGDEGRQFLNSVFVHNPLLDAGGQIGADANGFQPGVVASYLNESANPESWRLSLGVFGTGERGANYQRSLASPLIMAQAETALKLWGGLSGNYRLYAWRQGQGQERAWDGAGTIAKQAGWGISVDQQLGDGVSLFGRYGQLTQGKVPFDRALTLGAEFSGSYWNRGGDVIGVAAGWLRASQAYRADSGSDFDGDGAADYLSNGAERVGEIYYRYRISQQFELSPDFQYIAKLGGNPDAKAVKILGLRAQLAF